VIFARANIMLPAVATTLAGLAIAAPSAAADCRGLEDADAVVCEVNRVRDARGLDRLRRDRRLERAGASHARDMVRRGYFSHVTPEGETVSDRLRGAGYLDGRASWRVGETLAWGRRRMSTPAATVDAWMESPPHRRVLLNGRYREIGVGVAGGAPSGGAGTTFAAEFGVVGG
jgi:uncharacterized protein YkwD